MLASAPIIPWFCCIHILMLCPCLSLVGAYRPVKVMREKISDNGHNLFLFNIGRESAIADKHVLSEIWRNRRLMASPNGTHEGKNCTEPGKI